MNKFVSVTTYLYVNCICGSFFCGFSTTFFFDAVAFKYMALGICSKKDELIISLFDFRRSLNLLFKTFDYVSFDHVLSMSMYSAY